MELEHFFTTAESLCLCRGRRGAEGGLGEERNRRGHEEGGGTRALVGGVEKERRKWREKYRRGLRKDWGRRGRGGDMRKKEEELGCLREGWRKREGNEKRAWEVGIRSD